MADDARINRKRYFSASGRTLDCWREAQPDVIRFTACGSGPPGDHNECVTVTLSPGDAQELREHLTSLLASMEPGTIAAMNRKGE